MKQLADTEYLRHLYQSGCAFYMHGSCPAIDIAASVRVNGTYYPLVVSVKTRRTVTKGEARTACDAMKVAFDHAEIKYGFCILLLIGLDDPNTDYGGNLLQGSDLTNTDSNSIISKVIAVPTEDEFGISDFVTNTTVGGNGISEVYASHGFLTNFMKSNYEDEEKSTLLRKSADKEVSGYLSKFATCCLLSSTGGGNAASQDEMAMGEAVPPENPMDTS
jgi:hypothetical protein